jgi:hypothetical protein
MHVKWKYVIPIVWNILQELKFHFYHLATMLGIFFCSVFSNGKGFYKKKNYIVNEVSKQVMFFFQFRNLRGMLKIIKGLCDWCRKDWRTINRLWRWRIVKQDE